MKKVLLASTALAGATALAGGAQAGTPSVGDNLSVTISGNLRVSYLIFDQENFARAGRDRGYQFRADESEVKFAASNTADNGIRYGFEIEIRTQTDDTDNSDETWMFLDGGDSWGRIEMGDQDSAGDRIFIGGEDSMPGRGGYGGAVGDVFVFTNTAFSDPSFDTTGDATKIIYFTPRFSGFQLGASFTPDSGQLGGATISDNDGDFERVFSVGANYSNTFGDVGLIVAGAGEFGKIECDSTASPGPGPTDGCDTDFYRAGGGAQVTYAGFSLAGGFVAQEDARIVTDATNGRGFESPGDDWWADVGLNYSTGPWKVGGGYFYSETENKNPAQTALGNNDETEVQIFSIGGNYNVAPGFDIATDVNFVENDKINKGQGGTGDKNDGTVFVLSTIMSF